MSNADKIQHGGDHYKGVEYEHWNFVADMELDYFSACASKYIVRHAKKNGKQDVEKAKHFLLKKIELIESGLLPAPRKEHSQIWGAKAVLMKQFQRAYMVQQGSDEFLFIWGCCLPTHVDDLRSAVEAADRIIAEYVSGRRTPPIKNLPAAAEYPSHVAAAMEPGFGPEGWWGDGRVLWKCKHCNAYFKASDGVLPSTAHKCSVKHADPADPTPTYVNQG